MQQSLHLRNVLMVSGSPKTTERNALKTVWPYRNRYVCDCLIVLCNCSSLLSKLCTGCGRNNSHILKVNKNQTKQGTQKILLFIKSTYDAIFFQTLLKITSLKCRPLLMTNSWSRSWKLSMALRVIAGGMAATSCHIASFNCSIVPGRRVWELFLPHPVYYLHILIHISHKFYMYTLYAAVFLILL